MTSARLNEADSRVAVLLVGHGTRDSQGVAEFLELAQLVTQRLPGYLVLPTFLELAEPTIAAGVAAALATGARRLIVAPLLLFAAGHAKEDVPQAVRATVGTAAVEVAYAPALDCHPRLLELSRRRFDACLAESGIAADETLLVFAGRGSRDAQATAAMHRFAQLRAAASGVAACDVGFLAMAEPRIDKVLAAAARSAYRQIVVQPHLLFSGLLLAELSEMVQRLKDEKPQHAWRMTAHLGPDELLSQALVDLVLETARAPTEASIATLVGRP